MFIQKTSLNSIGKEKSLRFDVDYIKYCQSHTDCYYSFSDLFTIVPGSGFCEDAFTGPFKYCEIGDSDKNGNVYPVDLDFNRRNLLEENYYAKIEKGNITSVLIDDILISKVRPNLKKYIRITPEKLDLFFTTAFIRLQAKEMPDLLYYCLRSVFYRDIMAIARQGKGYPTINESDLATLRFDKTIVDKLRSKYSELSELIHQVENQINQKMTEIVPQQEIIDLEIQRVFDVDLNSYNTIETKKDFKVMHSSISDCNSNLRMSYRWNKSVFFQKNTLAQINNCSYLGAHIIDCQNGWSPACNENLNGYQVLGVDAITNSGILSFENPKYSTVHRDDIDSFYIHKGDFFVSRGNTVDLVALAAVSEIDVSDIEETIFPDLMIRVRFDDEINVKYMAHVFNSFIGRHYFKYCTKGKNQTMVKVTPKELNDFLVPIPDMGMQETIVKDIQREMDKQNSIRTEINNLRMLIENAIEKAVNE